MSSSNPQMNGAGDRLRVLLHLRAEEETTLLAAYDEIRHQVVRADGHLSDQLLQSLDDPCEWVITSEWETAEHYAVWSQGHAVDALAAPVVASSTDRRHRRHVVRRHTTLQDTIATTPSARVVDVDDAPANTKRGGELRVLLSPKTVGATAGFMGVAVLQPGERIDEHYHPYSEEYTYVMTGAVTLELDGAPSELGAGQAVLVPTNVRHRMRNTGDVEARIAFFLTPLAPRPELGHVDTEGEPRE